MQLARISSRPLLLAFASRFSSSSASSTAEATTRVLRIGDVLKVSKRFSESDVSGYSSISGDRNPIHFDDAFARAAAGFDRGRVVHGMLVASLFPSLMATHFPGAVYVSQTLKFKLPVYIEYILQQNALHLRIHSLLKEKRQFGHPEWIDFPREGDGWSYDKCRRQWNLVDTDHLRLKVYYRVDESAEQHDEEMSESETTATGANESAGQHDEETTESETTATGVDESAEQDGLETNESETMATVPQDDFKVDETDESPIEGTTETVNKVVKDSPAQASKEDLVAERLATK